MEKISIQNWGPLFLGHPVYLIENVFRVPDYLNKGNVFVPVLNEQMTILKKYKVQINTSFYGHFSDHGFYSE